MVEGERAGPTLAAILNGNRRKLQFNEAVNFGQRCIFIAVPKTGTSSIRRQLRPRGRMMFPEPHLSLEEIRRGLFAYFLRKSLGRRDSVPPPGALPTDADLVRLTDTVMRDVFSFGSVRNPFARAVSLYHRREGVQMARDLSFRDFCLALRNASDTCTNPLRFRNQADWLKGEGGAIAVDYVMRLEDRAEALAEIRDRTEGRLDLRNLHANANPASTSRSYRDLYDTETRAHIETVFAEDLEVFDYGF